MIIDDHRSGPPSARGPLATVHQPPASVLHAGLGRTRRAAALCVGGCLAALLPLAAAAQTTIQNTTYNSGQNVAESGSATITAGPAVTVSSGANVTYQATTRVTLSPGFTATAGSSFHAYIGSGVGGTYTLTVVGGTGGASGLTPGTVRTIVADPPPSGETFTGWIIVFGSGSFADPAASSTTFTLGASDATIAATYSTGELDSDGDGVSDAVEIMLGLNPYDPSDVNVYRYEYDKINQLERGPGGQYKKDAEGNIKETRP